MFLYNYRKHRNISLVQQTQICPIFIIHAKLNLKVHMVAKTIGLYRIGQLLGYDMLEGSTLKKKNAV